MHVREQSLICARNIPFHLNCDFNGFNMPSDSTKVHQYYDQLYPFCKRFERWILSTNLPLAKLIVSEILKLPLWRRLHLWLNVPRRYNQSLLQLKKTFDPTSYCAWFRRFIWLVHANQKHFLVRFVS